MELVIYGIKCDNTKCDWEDTTISPDDYIDHINAPCPKCGENILTEEDYELVVKMRMMTELLNGIKEFQELQPDFVPPTLEEVQAAFSEMQASLSDIKGSENISSENITSIDQKISVYLNAHKQISIEKIEISS